MPRIKFKDSWLERRMIWMANGDVPAAAEKPVEKIDAAKDKLDAEKMDEIAGRIKTLNIDQTKVGDGKKPADVYEFKKALKAKLQEGGNGSLESTLNVKNLDVFLMNGLLENLSKADAAPTKVSPAESGVLTRWIKDKRVTEFEIKDGYWTFYDDSKPHPKAIQDDYKLDDQDAKEGGKPDGEKVGGSKVEKAVLSKSVKEIKDRDKAEAEKKAEAAKVESERLKPENLEKVNSSKSVILKRNKSIKDLAKSLVESISKEDKPPGITAEEIQKSLSKYIAESLGDTNTDSQLTSNQFTSFMKMLQVSGYTQASIIAGKIVFEGLRIKPTSNPSNLQKPKENGGFDQRETWAHEALQGRAIEQQEAAEKVEATAKTPKKTPLDGTEAEVAKLISGKEAPTDKDLANVDQRYLPALQNILSYNDGGPVNVSLPFNDVPLDCQFYRTGRGTYVLAWEGGKNDRFTEYNPKEKGPAGLKEAQKYFVNTINSGQLLQQIQANNIKAKAKFEEKGMVVDDGPKILPGGAVKYEFDWATGLGGDPDVTIRPLPHGALAVTVEQSDVALDGSKKYEFVAGGFQDMTRTLKTLQKYAEAPDTEKANMKNDEADRRFLAQGKDVLQLAATPANAGKILRIDSVKAFNVDAKFSETNMTQGYKLDFDWMQKMQPPQNLRIYKSGDGYALNMQPSNQDIGFVKPPLEQNFGEAMRMVAAQKEIITTAGGEKLMTGRAQRFLDKYNGLDGPKNGRLFGKLEFAAGVRVAAVSADAVYLAREGLVARKFIFDKPQGIGQAKAEGYLVDQKSEKVEPAPPEKPLDSVPVRVNYDGKESDAKKPDIEKPIDSPEKTTALEKVTKSIFGPNKEIAKNYLAGKLYSQNSVETTDAGRAKYYEKIAWEALASFAKVEPAVGETSESDAFHKKVITKVNKSFTFAKELENRVSNDERMRPIYDKIKNLPTTKALVMGLIDTLDNVPLMISNGMDENTYRACKKAYIDGVIQIVNDLLTTSLPKKTGQSNLTYDKLIKKNLMHSIRRPENFFKEYSENEGKRVALKNYNDTQKKNAEDLKPGMTFAELGKQTMGGVVPDAFQVMRSTKGIDLESVSLAKVPGNGPVTEQVSFNVKAGPAGEQTPVTITFWKKADQLYIGGADGWNNAKQAKLPITSRLVSGTVDAVKEVSDDVRKLGTDRRAKLPKGVDAVPPKPADTPTSPPA